MAGDWHEDEGELVTERRFADFGAALAFVNAVGALAEEQDHHPDILLHAYCRVRLTLTTHDAGARVTDADHRLAAAIDALPAG